MFPAQSQSYSAYQQSLIDQGIDPVTGGAIQTAPQQVAPSATQQIAQNLGQAGGIAVKKQALQSALSGSGQASGGADAGASAATAMGATPLYVPAAAAIGTYLAGKQGLNLAQGKGFGTSTTDKLGRAQLAISTGGISELAKNVMGGKSQVQQSRDKLRSALQSSGIADGSFNVNGLDIGQDGRATIKNTGTNVDGSTSRHLYDTDYSNPLAMNAVSALTPLAMQITGDKAGQSKQYSDLMGMLSNSVLNGAKDANSVYSTVNDLYQKAGLGKQDFSKLQLIQNPLTTALSGGAQTKAPGTPAAAPAPTSVRSSTSSPGISKTGQRIKY